MKSLGSGFEAAIIRKKDYKNAIKLQKKILPLKILVDFLEPKKLCQRPTVEVGDCQQ